MSKKRLIFALAAGLAILTAAPEVVNDAPGVTVDLGGAAVMHRTGVPYPAAALKQGVQGTVVVELKLDANGNVADARIVSGPDELRNAALQSVLQWHLMKNLAGSSRQVSISFRVPEVSPGVTSGVTGGASAGVLAWISVKCADISASQCSLVSLRSIRRSVARVVRARRWPTLVLG